MWLASRTIPNGLLSWQYMAAPEDRTTNSGFESQLTRNLAHQRIRKEAVLLDYALRCSASGHARIGAWT